MTKYSKTYHIPLKPIRWKHPGKNGKHYYDLQVKEKSVVGLYLLREHKESRPFQGPVHIECRFYMALPKCLRDREPSLWHSKAPDCTNLVKFLEDSITKVGIWKDDRQVAWQDNRKIYDKEPRIEITITELL